MSIIGNLFKSIKGVGKILLLSRPGAMPKAAADGKRLIIMGNGPSLSDTIRNHGKLLHQYPSLSVNFAALSPEFASLKPRYYVLADPHFFGTADGSEDNRIKLREALAHADWPMTLLVPAKYGRVARRLFPGIEVQTFNAVGIEGFRPLCHAAFRAGLAMPRPRNVLIPAIMLGIALGYKELIIFGADHSWMQTLAVTDDNEVVSVQPHFYAESGNEQARVRHEYRNYRLHQIVESFAIAFRAYHDIENYARSIGVKIYNATPGSMIDAFERVRPEGLL